MRGQVGRLLAGFLLSLCLVNGAPGAILDGFITAGASGETVQYARLSLSFVAADSARAVEEGKPLIVSGAISNQAGYYAIRGVAAGRYALTCQAFGFRIERRLVTLGEEGTERSDFGLLPEAIDIEGVEVTAETDREEGFIQPGFKEVSAQFLQRLPGIGERDIFKSLQQLPGIQASSDISSGLYIRGGGPDQTLILLDQIPLYNPTHLFGFFSTFNADAIKDVALYKGAYPSQYGGRLGAVLDVANRDGNRKKFEGHGGVSVIAGRTTIEGPVGTGSWILSGRRTYLDPILSAVRSDDNEVPAYYFYDLNGRINQSFGADENVVLSGYRGRDDMRLDLDEGSFVDIGWGNTAGTLKWTHLFQPGLFGNFLVASSEYRSRTEVEIFETPILLENRLLDVTGKADLDWRVNSSHRLVAGLWASHFSFSFDQEFNGSAQQGFDERPNALSVYLQDEWQESVFTTIRPGLRAEFFGKQSRLYLEPRLSVSRALSPDFRLKAAGGIYTQHLQLVTTEGFTGADFWVPTDRTVDPGRSWQVVSGAEWEPSAKYSLSAEVYYTGMRNLLQYDNQTTQDDAGASTEELFKTGGTGWASGVELFAEQRVGALTGWLGYTLGWSRRRFEEVNQGKTFPPKYDRRHDIKAVLDLKRGEWSFGANFILASGQAFTPAGSRYLLTVPGTGTEPVDGFLLPAPKNSGRLLPYHRLDVSMARTGSLFGLRAEYFLQVFNAYNRENEWFVTYDTSDPLTEPTVTHQLPFLPTVGVNFEF